VTADNESITTPETNQPQRGRAGDERADGRSRLWAMLAVILVVALVLLLIWTRLVPRVPDVTGMTRLAAETKLKGAGYKTGEISLVTTSKIQPGHVADQAPRAGAVLGKGGSVDLIVVQGAETVTVPDVVGQDAASAAQIIGQTGLGMNSVGQYDDKVPAGAVIAQVPLPGTQLPANAAVTVIVSYGVEPASGSPIGSSSGSSTAPGSGASGGNGVADEPAISAFSASYPGSSVYSSGGDIYISIPSGGTRHLTSGTPWDTDPILSPNARYVVFLRAPSQGAGSNQVGRVNLTNNQTVILDLPYPSDFCSASQVRYSSMRFAPSPTGTSPGSDWLVIGQLFPNDPDSSGQMGGRLLVCNAPMDSTWVSWNQQLRPATSIVISGSSRAGCVGVRSYVSGTPAFDRAFNAYTGLYF